MKSDAFLERIIRNWPAKILSIAAAVFLFLFYRFSSLEERNFSVPLDLRVQDGFIPVGAYPRGVRVTLRGPEDEIYLILESDINAYVDFSEHRTEGMYREPVSFTREGTALRVNPLEISVDPSELTLNIERKIERSIPVAPSFSGHPQKGFELGQYFISPEEVYAEGPRSKLQGVESLSTETVDLSGKTEDFTVTVNILPEDPLILLPKEDTVVIHCTIHEIILLKTFTISDIVVLDIPSGLELVSEPIRGSIRVQGSQLELERYTTEQFFLTVDCSDVPGPGQYTLPVRPEAPPGLIVLKYEPQSAVLEFGPETSAPEEASGEDTAEAGEADSTDRNGSAP